ARPPVAAGLGQAAPLQRGRDAAGQRPRVRARAAVAAGVARARLGSDARRRPDPVRAGGAGQAGDRRRRAAPRLGAGGAPVGERRAGGEGARRRGDAPEPTENSPRSGGGASRCPPGLRGTIVPTPQQDVVLRLPSTGTSTGRIRTLTDT